MAVSSVLAKGTPHLPMVVIGDGVAGLATALAAAPTEILLLGAQREPSTGSSLPDGITTHAGTPHAIAVHLANTLAAGVRHNEVSAARRLVESTSAVRSWLQQQGMAIDGEQATHLACTEHANQHDLVRADPAVTVAGVRVVLGARARAASHVDWRHATHVDALLVRDGCVAGVRMCDGTGHATSVEAAAVVLATGGIAELFAHSSGGPSDDGAGLALALVAGAWPRDLEFLQFAPPPHMATDALPTSLAAGFHLGGVAVDLAGHTSLPGLHAVGEVACSGAHGAGLLPGNALLEAVASGLQVGTHLRRPPPLPASGAFHWAELGTPLRADHLAALRDLMWRVAGPVREVVALRDAWRICTAAAQTGWQMRLAKALLRAMRIRKQSLGVHVRVDRGCPLR